MTGTVSAVVGDETITRSASMECTVKSLGVKARIRGGKNVKRFTNQRVLIDGTVSRDRDNTSVLAKPRRRDAAELFGAINCLGRRL